MTAQTNLPPFHLAFPVRDLEEARAFYGVKLGCPEGRSSPEWIDFNFYGHQIVAHLAPGECGHRPPARWIRIMCPCAISAPCSMEQWEDMAKRLTDAGTEFVIEPYIRFKGEVGEQATMFFLDPSGNALEFKAFKTWIPCSPNNLSNQVSCR